MQSKLINESDDPSKLIEYFKLFPTDRYGLITVPLYYEYNDPIFKLKNRIADVGDNPDFKKIRSSDDHPQPQNIEINDDRFDDNTHRVEYKIPSKIKQNLNTTNINILEYEKEMDKFRKK